MAEEGPISPSTCSNDATIGTRSWSNPTNAQIEDGSYARVNVKFVP